MENTNKRKTDSLRVLIAALLCLIVPYMASAQQAVTVQGRVTDAENQPLIGVSVLVKGTTTGVSTGIDGDYMKQLHHRAKSRIERLIRSSLQSYKYNHQYGNQ
ncbi:conserved hypothetical protein, membrane or secreted, partial [human gut metagenome]